MDALTSASPLIIYVDVKSPYAFVAIGPTLALEKELGLVFDWRPLTLDIPSYLGSATKKDGQVVQSTGRSERLWRAIRHAYFDSRRYAERQGLMLKGTEKIWDSSIANMAILWAAQQNRPLLSRYLRGVFEPFWRRELDIEDISVVEACLADAGITTKGFRDFAAKDGRQLHDRLQAKLHPCGIFGVPTYVLDGEVFFGREHLPLIRWSLSGRRGPAPDIAYEIAPC